MTDAPRVGCSSRFSEMCTPKTESIAQPENCLKNTKAAAKTRNVAMQKSGRKGAGNCNRKSCNARKWQEMFRKLPPKCFALFLCFGDGAQKVHCNIRDHLRIYVFLWIGCAGYWLTKVRIATKTLWPHTRLAKCIDFPTPYQSRTQPNAISFAAGDVLF